MLIDESLPAMSSSESLSRTSASGSTVLRFSGEKTLMHSRPGAFFSTRRVLFAPLFTLLASAAPISVRAADATEKFLQSEQLGSLKLGLGEKEVLKLLGQPKKKGGLVLQEADGMWVQQWKYPDEGLSILMGAGKKAGAKAIANIKASAPCTLATKAGIKIGSPAAAVAKAYAQHLDKENPPTAKQLIVGIIYGGIIFDLEKGKVTSIFFGAAAE